MSFQRTVTVLAFAALASSACTGRSTRAVEVQKQPEPSTEPTHREGDATFEVPVSQETLKAAYAPYGVLNMAALSYKFSYLSVTDGKPITFDAAGVAKLTFSGLPAGQSGTVILEIYEGTPGVLKLKASQDNVTLTKAGPNNLKLQLLAVDPATGGVIPGTGAGTTDLNIEVVLANPGSTPPVNNPPVNNPPPADPVAAWDGKSFQGNTKWKIVEVN